MNYPNRRFRCSVDNIERKTAFARQMRNNPTPAENRLWTYLRCHRLGVKFSRQRLILGYITDFYCPPLKLVVEVDGSAHNNTTEYDDHRDLAMKRAGFTVIRFNNAQIFTDTKTVLNRIRDTVELLTYKGPK